MSRLASVHRPRAAALAAYLGISLLYFGVPILAHPGRGYIGHGPDPEIFIWSLAWWPHAILHGENPFITHAVWAPVAVDLAWITSVPGLALALAPVTLLAGPTVAYNAAALLLPALAAWTAFLLCAHLTRSFWPSFAGGYLFGFSSYMLGQAEGHVHMTSVFPVPLIALALVRFVEGSIGGRRLALWLGLLLVVQISLSTEVFFTVTIGLLLALALAFAIVPAARPRLRLAPLPIAGAYVLAAVLASPLLFYVLSDFEGTSINAPELYPADLLNLVVPTSFTGLNADWARAISDSYLGTTAENGAYLGVPLLAIIAWFAWERRGSAAARLVVTLIAVGVVAELGSVLHVGGAAYSPLPWKLVANLPAFDNVLPVRFSLYVALASSVTVALWAAASVPPLWARAALVCAAVLAILPHLWLGFWHVQPNRPTFFASGLYRSCLDRNENVLVLPYATQSDAMLWQAEGRFYFRMAAGYLSPVVPDGVPHPASVRWLIDWRVPPGGGRAIVAFARAQGARSIVVDGTHGEPWRTVLARTGLRPETVGGISLYRLDRFDRRPCNEGLRSRHAEAALGAVASRVRGTG